MVAPATRPPAERRTVTAPVPDDRELRARIGEILNRHPSVGLAVGVVRDGRLAFFHGHGVADVASRSAVTEDTVFRIGSITKTVTAIAVMQLWERGLVDLDAPANDYLRAFKLVPAEPGFRPATVRHLLTHTAGVPEAIHLAELLRFDWGPFEGRPIIHSVAFGERLPSLAEYYRGGLRYVVEPGTAFAYSNHGFPALGQIVEDVTGEPLDRYLRDHIFEPLGMSATDLVRSDRVAPRLATGYVFGSRGAVPVPDRDWIGGAGGAIYSSTREIARYAAALLAGGQGEDGRVLQQSTLDQMFEPNYQTDPRLPSIGLAFFRVDAGGHRIVRHGGLMPGFTSELWLAPDDGVAVMAFTNGSSGAMAWLPAETAGLLHHLLGVPDDMARADIPHHPEIWPEICGRYYLPARIGDLRGRVVMAGGVDVLARGGQLVARIRAPIPALYRGFPLLPDDERDPYVFRLDLTSLGMSTIRVVFGRDGRTGARAVHVDLDSQPVSLYERPAGSGIHPLVRAAMGTLGLIAAVRAVRSRRGATAKEERP